MFGQNQDQQQLLAGYHNMANPLMPQNYNHTQFSNRQEYQHLLQMDGWEKLKYCQKVTMKKIKSEGFSETCWTIGFPTQIDIKFEEQATEEVFEVKFDSPSCCSSQVSGEFNSLIYFGDNQNKQKLLDIDYKRQCICLKEALCIVPIFGWLGLLQCLVNPCCKSKALLKKDGNQVNEVNIGFDCCVPKNITIKNNQQEPRFILKRQKNSDIFNLVDIVTIEDGMGRNINHYKIQIVYVSVLSSERNHQRKIDFIQVDLPQNGDIQDKVALIFAASKYFQ